MKNVLQKYFLYLFLGSTTCVTILLILNNTLYTKIKNKNIEQRNSTITNIIKSNQTYISQELYLGNEDAIKQRIIDLSFQIYQSTNLNVCISINEITTCPSNQDYNEPPLQYEIRKDAILVHVIDTYSTNKSNYYRKSFYLNMIGIVLIIIFISYITLKLSLIPLFKSNELLRSQIRIKQSNDKICHDIKSPLTSLDFLIDSIKIKINEHERVLAKQSLERINDIILTLETTDSMTSDDPLDSNEILHPLLKRIVAEKRVEYGNRKNISINLINNLSYGVFVKINKSNLSRSLSNLINNSIQAIDKDTINVTITLFDNNTHCFIQIIDDGTGINNLNLNNIFTHGFSTKKRQGKGIGLSQAKHHIEEAGGQITITSPGNKGTTVLIKLNKSKKPNWFKENLTISQKLVCTIDDDKSIHSLWKQRLRKSGIKVMSFSSSFEFERWYSLHKEKEPYYLFDLELINSPCTGIDLIEKYSLSSTSTLVTSHYGNNEIQEKAKELKIKIIPKESASKIPIIESTFSINSSLILIDDDHLVHDTWDMMAQKRGYKLRSYFTPEEFLLNSDQYDKSTPVYIDSHLSNNKKGEHEAQLIYKKGFQNIYLQTGYQIKVLPKWIKGQQDKRFPY